MKKKDYLIMVLKKQKYFLISYLKKGKDHNLWCIYFIKQNKSRTFMKKILLWLNYNDDIK